MAIRRATAVWEGDLKTGTGRLSTPSGELKDVKYTFDTRFADKFGTNPEELIAAAHSACLAMNLSGVLGQEGITADSIDVSAEVTLSTSAAGAEISGIDITLRAAVPGLDAARFAELASTAERTCPVSKALAATKITLDAALA